MVTHEEALQHIVEYAVREIKERARRLVNCGGISEASYPDKPYLYARAIVAAAVQEVVSKVLPAKNQSAYRKVKADFNNLQHF